MKYSVTDVYCCIVLELYTGYIIIVTDVYRCIVLELYTGFIIIIVVVVVD